MHSRLYRRHLAHIWLIVATAFVVGYFLLMPASVQDLLYQVPGMAAVGAVLIGVAVQRPPNRWPWLLLALGIGLTSVGDWSFVYIDRFLDYDPFPSFADAFYLSGMGLVAATVVWLARGRLPGGDRAGLLDALIVAVGVGLVSWTIVMEPLVKDPATGTLETLVALAYPVLDVLLVGILVRLFLAPGPQTTSLRLLLAGLIAVLLADVPYTFMALDGGYYTGHIVEAGWLMSATFWGAAALHPSVADARAPVLARHTRFSARRLLLLTSASLMSPAVLVFQWGTGRHIDVPVIAAGSVILFVLVIARLDGVAGDLRNTLRQRHRLERELERRALHDPLTGLANRALFNERLASALARHSDQVAVLFIDLDDFKAINDTFGHHAGDLVLGQVAEAIRASVRPGDTVARLGGDEFAVLLAGSPDAEEAAHVAERVLRAVGAPLAVSGQDRVIGASIGISLGSSETTHAEQLMREADIAMYIAKAQGKGDFCLFDPQAHATVVNRIGLRADLEKSVTDGQLRLAYQPIIDIATGELRGIEALVRWQHPERGLLPPSEFVPLAEATGMIVPIGGWVLDEVFRQVAAWRASGPDPIGTDRFVSVNLSAVHLGEPTLASHIRSLLREADLAPRQLVLEVTESAQQEIESCWAVLGHLRAMGVRMAIDDFGTGYSSLSRLLRSPFDVMKVDRTLIVAMETDQRAEALVAGIIDMARRLGATVIAEGVENAHQLSMLRQMGCELAQGFHLFTPLSATELLSQLRVPGAAAPAPAAAPALDPAPAPAPLWRSADTA